MIVIASIKGFLKEASENRRDEKARVDSNTFVITKNDSNYINQKVINQSVSKKLSHHHKPVSSFSLFSLSPLSLTIASLFSPPYLPFTPYFLYHFFSFFSFFSLYSFTSPIPNSPSFPFIPSRPQFLIPLLFLLLLLFPNPQFSPISSTHLTITTVINLFISQYSVNTTEHSV